MVDLENNLVEENLNNCFLPVYLLPVCTLNKYTRMKLSILLEKMLLHYVSQLSSKREYDCFTKISLSKKKNGQKSVLMRIAHSFNVFRFFPYDT